MQIVWRRREENPWLHEAELRVKEIVPVVSHEETDHVHCGPGPFSMAGPDMASTMLRLAGFKRITFEHYDCDICIGRDMEDAIEFAMALGPAGEIIRLAGAEGEKRKPQMVASLKEALAPYARPDGIWAPSPSKYLVHQCEESSLIRGHLRLEFPFFVDATERPGCSQLKLESIRARLCNTPSRSSELFPSKIDQHR